nr:hypothetical protein Iba_chr04bCG10130 [Ipomoea batatas]
MLLEGSEHEFDATFGSWATNPFKASSYHYKTVGKPDNFSLPNESSATLRKVLPVHLSAVLNVWAACSLGICNWL